MIPEKLRTWSLRSFKMTIYFAVAGIIIIITLPNPAFADTARLAVKITAWTGFSFILIAIVTNIVSLVTGAIAWFKGSKHCAWIIISLAILLFPVAIYILILLNQ
jgi:hypothetical protein